MGGLLGSIGTGLGSVETAGEPFEGSGSGAAPDPDVANADMILDLDAQAAGMTIDGLDRVTKWPDQSQYGNDADQTEFFGPTPLWATFNAAGINGLPSVTVGNSETKGIGKNNIAADHWLSNASNWTSISVCESDGPNGPLPFIPGFDGIVFPRISLGAYSPSAGVQDAVASFTGGFTAIPFTDGKVIDYAGKPIILTVVCFADVVTVRINGEQRTIGPVTGSDLVAFRSYVLGLAGGDGTLTEVGEQRFYKVPLNDTLVEEREGFLSAKWRIPLQPVIDFVESVTATDATAINNTDPQDPVVLQATAARGGTLRKEDFAKLTAVPDGAIVPVALRTAVSDLTAAGVRSFLLSSPPPAGKKFYSLGRIAIEIVTLTGTAGGGPMNCQFEVNGAVVGSRTTVPVTFASGTLNNTAADGTGTYFQSASSYPGGNGIDLSAHPLDINVLSTFTGLTAFTGRFLLLGYFA